MRAQGGDSRCASLRLVIWLELSSGRGLVVDPRHRTMGVHVYLLGSVAFCIHSLCQILCTSSGRKHWNQQQNSKVKRARVRDCPNAPRLYSLPFETTEMVGMSLVVGATLYRMCAVVHEARRRCGSRSTKLVRRVSSTSHASACIDLGTDRGGDLPVVVGFDSCFSAPYCVMKCT